MIRRYIGGTSVLCGIYFRLGGNPDKDGKDLDALEDGEELEDEEEESTSESEEESEDELPTPPVTVLPAG